jgi:hypothetical protein
MTDVERAIIRHVLSCTETVVAFDYSDCDKDVQDAINALRNTIQLYNDLRSYRRRQAKEQGNLTCPAVDQDQWSAPWLKLKPVFHPTEPPLTMGFHLALSIGR